MTDKLIIEVTRDGWTKGLQLNIAKVDENDEGWGYRLAGPKLNGSGESLLRHELDERDAAEIRTYLDDVFPVNPSTELEHLRKDRDAFRDRANGIVKTNERLLAEVQESDQARLRAENADAHDDLAAALGYAKDTEWSDLISIAASATTALARAEMQDAETKRLRDRVAELEADSARLNALYAAGVDNWEGYSLAFSEEDEDDD